MSKKLSPNLQWIEDNIGKTMGKWTVIGESKQHQQTKTGCRITCCDVKCICGKIYAVEVSSLKYGRSKSCVKCKEHGTKRREPPFMETVRSVYRKAYADGDISVEKFMELSQLSCYYCGKPPSNKVNKPLTTKGRCKFAQDNGWWTYNGLDRVDNDLPHTISNSVPCCKACNFAKRATPQSDFISWIETTYKHLRSIRRIE